MDSELAIAMLGQLASVIGLAASRHFSRYSDCRIQSCHLTASVAYLEFQHQYDKY